MDLTSLLNTSVGTNPDIDRDPHYNHTEQQQQQKQQSQENPPTTKQQATGWAGLPTPSPEKSPPRPSAPALLTRQPGLKSRTPWDAGGYSLPLSLDTKFFPAANTGPVIYGGSPDTVSMSMSVHSHSHSAVTPLSGHSRNTSLESSPADMVSSALVSPMTTSHSLRPAFIGEGSQLEIPMGRRASTISETDAQLTARRPGFLNPQDGLFSPSGSPRSPQHKFSDSHSSFSSSYTPSSRSGSHSRISSFSTVGMVQPLSTLLSEIPSIEEKVERGECGGEDALRFRGQQGPQQPPPSSSYGHQRFSSWAPPPPPPQELAGHEAGKGPRSPSDAFLINREADCGSRVPTNNEFIATLQQPAEFHQEHHRHHQHHDQVNALPSSSSFLVSHRFRHKRAISAPSFAQPTRTPFSHPTFRNFTRPHQSTLPTLPHLATTFMMSSPGENHGQEAGDQAPGPSSNNGQGVNNGDSGNSASTPAANPPPAGGSRAKNLHIRCEKVENCTTGTDRRKLISHTFGRNKACTRGIPESVWHHYCRKHYQRARYQQGKDYPKTQVNFVLSQLDRIQAWSDGNAESGVGTTVQDWALCIRKREKQRRSKSNANNDDSAEDEEDEDAIASGTAIPEWLAALIRPGYSTDEIRNIMTRVRDEIYSGVLLQIPDIEILPNLVGDNQTRRTQRRRSRAQTSQTSHRRAQSVTIPPPRAATGNSLSLAPINRRGSQPALRGLEDSQGQQQRAEKRKAEDSLEQPNTPPNARSRTTLPHRPGFSRIQEERSPHSPHEGNPTIRTGERMLPATSSYLTPRASAPRHNRSRSDIPRAVARPPTIQLPGMHSSASRNDNHGYPPMIPQFNNDPFRAESGQERRFSSFDESQVSRLNHARRVSTSAAGSVPSYGGSGGSHSIYPEQRQEAGVHLPPPGTGSAGHARQHSGASLPSLSQVTGQAFSFSGPEVGQGVSYERAYEEAYGGAYTGDQQAARQDGYNQGGNADQGHAHGPHHQVTPYHGPQKQGSEKDGGQSSQ